MPPPTPPTASPNGPPVKFTVTSQAPTTGIGPDGRPVQGYQVNFTTERGASGYVFIPYSMYTAANVQAAIWPHAYELDKVQTMGS